jgi:hypothetical protein
MVKTQRGFHKLFMVYINIDLLPSHKIFYPHAGFKARIFSFVPTLLQGLLKMKLSSGKVQAWE